MNRREFVCGAIAVGLTRYAVPNTDPLNRFRLGVITDEVNRDLAEALKFVNEFGL